ncbi:MAG: DUF3105 domain-containing protein [Candidatus Curtissbacteria bacterium]|nr:DUF3105 domain-containing protein [Candidatus Curtissbacteria bacterium]
MRRVPIAVWFILPTLVILVIGIWFFSKNSTNTNDELKPAEVSKEVEGVQVFPIAGREHISEATKSADYNSNPPTSGQHWSTPAKNGIYETELPDERVVHNLEHGNIWISYKKEISADVLNKLKEIVNKDDWKMIMTPREVNDSKIVVAAWGRLLKMEEPDYVRIEEFIKTYRNRGPENTSE